MINKSINIIYLNIAGFNIRIDFLPRLSRNKSYVKINNLSAKIIKLFKGYIVNQIPQSIDASIIIRKANPVTINKKLTDNNYYYMLYYTQKNENYNTYQHTSISQFTFLLIKILQDLLIKNHGFYLHASAGVLDNDAFIFVGRPNAGKSTILKFLRKKLKPVADDGVIIRKINSQYFLYQSPGLDKFSWIKKNKDRYLIKKIFILKKAKVLKTVKIQNNDKILPIILNQLWTTKQSLALQINYIKRFVEEKYIFYYLYFPNSQSKVKEKFKYIIS